MFCVVITSMFSKKSNGPNLADERPSCQVRTEFSSMIVFEAGRSFNQEKTIYFTVRHSRFTPRTEQNQLEGLRLPSITKHLAKSIKKCFPAYRVKFPAVT